MTADEPGVRRRGDPPPHDTGAGDGEAGAAGAPTRFDRERRTQTVCLLILSTIAIGVALFWLRPVMIPFVLAVFISYALAPVIDFLVGRLHTPPKLAIAAALLLNFVLLFALGVVVTSSVKQMAENRGTYVKQITAMAYQSYDKVASWVPLESVGLDYDSLERIVGPRPDNLIAEGVPDSETPATDSAAATPDGVETGVTGGVADTEEQGHADADQLSSGADAGGAHDLLGAREPELFPTPSFGEGPLASVASGDASVQGLGLRGFLGNVLSYTTTAIGRVASQGTLVMIFVLFLLIGRKPRAGRRPGVWGDIELRVKRYISTKVLTSGATGLLTWMILSILGVEPAMVFGLSAFLLNFIPSVGSMIATLLPVPVVLFAPDISTTTAILAVALPGAVQFTIGNVLEPKFMGDTLDLHPVVILLSMIFWGMAWGLVGMFLAVPITAVVKILLERSVVTAPIAEMMAGRLDEAERSSRL